MDFVFYRERAGVQKEDGGCRGYEDCGDELWGL